MKTFEFDNNKSIPLDDADLKTNKINREEETDIKAMENREYASVSKSKLKKYKKAFSDAKHKIIRQKTKPVTIRISETDIALLQKKAAAEGLPYQTYIKSQLHKIAIN